MDKNTKIIILIIVLAVIAVYLLVAFVIAPFFEQNFAIVNGQVAVDNDGTRTADAFLELLKADKVSDAYQMTSAQFRANITLTYLEGYAQTAGFTAYNGTVWTSETLYLAIESGTTTLELKGISSSTVKPDEIPIYINLLQEGGAWKIEYIHVGDLSDVNISVPLF